MANDRLAETLLLLRRRANYSQEYVADTLGVHYTTYGGYEKNSAGLSANQVQKIAALYELSIDQLYNFDAAAVHEPSRNVGRPVEQPAVAATSAPVNTKRLLVTVELDGTDQVLNEWFARLKAVNRLLRKG